MRKIVILFTVCILTLFTAVPVLGAQGKVTYSGNAGQFVFEPGSEESLTDLFANFKDVMPGDTLTQQITVRNDADNKVKVKIYIRSLGADQESEAFLSQLRLQVAKSENNKADYMFDATADATAQLTDWVCLGTLYSGGEVNLDVTLTVPVELGNEFQNQMGSLKWEFMIEEYPIEPDDPEIPSTGDTYLYLVGIPMMLLGAMMILLVWRKKREE